MQSYAAMLRRGLPRYQRALALLTSFAAFAAAVCPASGSAQLPTPVPGSPFIFPAGNAGSGHNLVLSPDGTRLFVAHSNTRNLSVLNVAPNGTASYVGTYPIANVAGFPCGLAINPAGTFLYVVSYAQFRSRITVHNVNGASGALTQVQTMPFPFNTEGTTIGANAKNGIVYLVKGSTHYLYVVNEAGGLGNELEVFTVNPATGLLSSYFGRGLPASGIAEGDLIAPRLVANAAGTRLYLSIQRTSAVMCMEVQPNGIPNDVSYVALLATASGAVAVDPTDSYLYAGTTNGNVVKFSISPTGTLTRIASFSTGAGAGPVSGLAMHPNGQCSWRAGTPHRSWSRRGIVRPR